MRIGIVTGQFGGIFRGGAEIQAYLTVKHLENTGIEILNIDHSTTLQEIKSIDLVHFFKTDESYLTLTNLLISLKIPYVVSSIIYYESEIQKIYNNFVSQILSKRIRNLFVAGRRINFLRDAAWIFPNTNDEQSFVNLLVKSRVQTTVIPNCIHDDYFNRLSSPYTLENFDARNEKYILNVGRFEKRKNQFNICKAMVNLGLDMKLVCIGPIVDTEYYSAAKQVLGNNLLHLGIVNDINTLKFFYQNCELFCLPSTMETPGLVAMEALSQGAKVVITKVGGTKEYFDGLATFVDPGSMQSLEDGIKRSLRRDNIDVDMKKYSYETIANKYKLFYEQIINA